MAAVRTVHSPQGLLRGVSSGAYIVLVGGYPTLDWEPVRPALVGASPTQSSRHLNSLMGLEFQSGPLRNPGPPAGQGSVLQSAWKVSRTDQRQTS